MSKYQSIRRANFKMIELELYNYHESLQELEVMKNDIIESTASGEGLRVQNGVTDVTCRKADALMSSVAIRETERRVKAIEHAVNLLECHPDKDRIKLLKLKYFDKHLTDYGIQQEIGISERTYRNWRREIIQLVADRLGYRI